jgi:hypothetical protein
VIGHAEAEGSGGGGASTHITEFLAVIRALRSQGAPKGNPPPRGYLPASFFGDFWRFSGLILKNILMVFLGSACRETAQKRGKKEIDGKRRQGKKNHNFFGQKFLT